MEIARNELVYLLTDDRSYYAIHRCSDDANVGMINVYDGSLYFSIAPAYQHQHYCSNAVYLLTKYLINERKMTEISAFIPRKDLLSRHICEHAGYSLTEETPGMLVYIHDGHCALKEAIDEQALYLCGGCFWGLQHGLSLLDGVKETTCGYLNGKLTAVAYEDVCRGDSGFKECVKVKFDEDVLNINTLLEAFFLMIDPTQADGQANDIGEQYQTAIAYGGESYKEAIAAFVERKREAYPVFYTAVERAENFFKAEDYHQNYLNVHPQGYCHISLEIFEKIKELNQH